MDQIDRIRKSLGSASTWGTIDLFTDGFLADMAKYSHMDNAQSEMQELNRLLRQFSKELKDVDTHANLAGRILAAECGLRISSLTAFSPMPWP